MGKRMLSSKPKVLHEVLGRPMVAYCVHAAKYLEPSSICVVVGHGAREVKEALGEAGITYALQEVQLGTGHAAQAALKKLQLQKGSVIIMPGDVPLISPQTLLDFRAAHVALGADLSVLTMVLEDPKAYGRVLRDSGGWLDRIIEFKDATPLERDINEVNAGFYCCRAEQLSSALEALRPENKQGEYYLTDIVEVYRTRGKVCAAITAPDPQELQGVNDRVELSRCQEILRLKINESWLKAGVTMSDPFSVTIEAQVRLERDVTLGPGVIISGASKIGEGTTIGPYAVLKDVQVGQFATIGPHVVLQRTMVGSGAQVQAPGPVPRLRNARPHGRKAR